MPRDLWAEDKAKQIKREANCRDVEKSLTDRTDEPWSDRRSYKVRRHDLALKILHEKPNLTMAEAEREAGIRLHDISKIPE